MLITFYYRFGLDKHDLYLLRDRMAGNTPTALRRSIQEMAEVEWAGRVRRYLHHTHRQRANIFRETSVPKVEGREEIFPTKMFNPC